MTQADVEEELLLLAGKDGADLFAPRDERIDAATHPRVAASGRRIVEGSGEDRFRALLAIVLDGIEANRGRDRRRSTRAPRAGGRRDSADGPEPSEEGVEL